MSESKIETITSEQAYRYAAKVAGVATNEIEGWNPANKAEDALSLLLDIGATVETVTHDRETTIKIWARAQNGEIKQAGCRHAFRESKIGRNQLFCRTVFNLAVELGKVMP